MKNGFIIVFSFFLLLQSGCMEDTFMPNSPPLDDTDCNKLLAYVNAQGYFRKLLGEPALLTPDVIAANLNNYHIIDIRSHEEFTNGRITGAINVRKDSLITYLENYGNPENKTILFVCADGQLSSYVQCLVGLYGFNNLATLKYGMASWNMNFASVWTNNIRTITAKNEDYPLNNHMIFLEERYQLPAFELPQGVNLKERVNESIRQLLASTENISSDLMNNQTVFCDFKDVFQHFNYTSEVFENIELLCYGTKSVYSLYPSKYPEEPSHPIGTWWIDVPLQYDYRISSSVHFLANDRPLIFYSTDGHSSAFIVALLRLLGYNAKSMLYGLNSFQFEGMVSNYVDVGIIFNAVAEVKDDAFYQGKYGNYPYISGESD